VSGVGVDGVNGGGPDYSAIAFLTAKATIGFGTVIGVGSFVLQRVFELVARARSTETFVALCLLVSVGMGVIAKSLGLTDTAGAFAAGVLLANTNYRAQVQADILPFKGILLGIFFMDAGSSFDLELVMREFPTIITGVLALITMKAATLFAATKVPRWFEPNRLPQQDAVRISLLLSGGGEFAFVVLALAEKLGVLPVDLGGLLTAIVLISMALTPLLGDLAEVASRPFPKEKRGQDVEEVPEAISLTQIASDAIIICGHGEIGQSLLQVLGDNSHLAHQYSLEENGSLPKIVAFDNNPTIVSETKPNHADNSTAVIFGDAMNPEVLRSCGIVDPSAIFISFHDHANVLTATSRLRSAFNASPIYVRSQTRKEAQELQALGATEVVVEADELSKSAVQMLENFNSYIMARSDEDFRVAAASAAQVSLKNIDELLDWFDCLRKNDDGLVIPSVFADAVRNSNSGVRSDTEIDQMEEWVLNVVKDPLDCIGFCRLYATAPKNVQDTLGDACIL